LQDGAAAVGGNVDDDLRLSGRDGGGDEVGGGRLEGGFCCAETDEAQNGEDGDGGVDQVGEVVAAKGDLRELVEDVVVPWGDTESARNTCSSL
jgi:hypothetical protein